MSWEDLHTFEDICHCTFQAACLACGLLANNNKWQQCLQEASLTHVGKSLHHLFTLILTHCEPSQPNVLWNKFHDALCNDLCCHLQYTRDSEENIPQHDIYDFSLFLIDKDLCQHETSLSSFPSMPCIEGHWQHHHDNPYVVEQLNYVTDLEQCLSDKSVPLLNTEQCCAFDKIFQSMSDHDGKTFFLHGPGRTSKTFVYSTLCHCARANKWIVLYIASCGIASLLPGGYTVHSTFCIPVHGLCEDSYCQIDKKSFHTDMLHNV